ncbi:MAG: tRNA pseudouridine(55) synthase TruB [Bacteroidaceae bacterium]|nr:tRNA pseudouridine(55) synthase TruB [Bacteroidales bacterium]MBO5263565.1 tRNA pseudouridine(55) synthase TruB [Bacteroidaceae bacterium]MBQ8257640.1 tRNA pseudouridine(55) synthase TruB [Bacteroidaceae bacterium]
MDFVAGEVLAIYKPYTWTSFQIVNKVRYHLSRQLKVKRFKVGHAGTLDPLATGVLLVCTGKATKRIEELQSHTKEYVAEMMLGATTPSFDMEHPVNATFPHEHITEEMVKDVLGKFIGDIAQRPPLFSACKVDGKRAYDLARKGSDMELAPKQVRIDEIELLECDLPRIKVRVVCGKGTYIRSLARDIGEALDSGAYLTSLTRTRVGEFKVEQCIDPEEFPAWLEKQITV